MLKYYSIIILIFFYQFTNAQNSRLKITPLIGDFYIYTTYNFYEGNPIPAHGMYLVTKDGVVMFDTPWDTTQFQPLLDSILLKHKQRVTTVLATHWHSDRTEGLEYYSKQGVKTYTTVLTDELSKKNNKKRANFLMHKDTTFKIDKFSFEVYYPGEGHTKDNIIIWFEQEKILYGGCLIKGAEAKDLGFVGDANTKAYEATLKNVQQKCKNPKHIIVSHHNWQNKQSLKHSIQLAKKLKKEK